MPKTLLKSRLQFNKHKPKIKQELIITQSNLPPNFQSFKQKLLTGNGFIPRIDKSLFVKKFIWVLTI